MNSLKYEESSIVAKTNDEAVACRVSAVSLGYYDDKYVALLDPNRKASSSPSVRKSPLINRGTYIRTKSIDYHINNLFLDSLPADNNNNGPLAFQIVSLGAGSDSRFFQFESLWKLKAKKSSASSLFKYYEIDFPEVTSKKARLIYKHKELLEKLENPTIKSGGSELESKNYHLIPGNLNDARTIETISEIIDNRQECFASYLPAVSLERIISFVATRFSHVSFLAYEMANADDAFGQVMIRNLRQRGLEMGNVMSQIEMERLFQSFFGNCSVTAMRNVYQSMVDETEHERLNRIEMMDEWEEWNLILQHYCLIYAWK